MEIEILAGMLFFSIAIVYYVTTKIYKAMHKTEAGN